MHPMMNTTEAFNMRAFIRTLRVESMLQMYFDRGMALPRAKVHVRREAVSSNVAITSERGMSTVAAVRELVACLQISEIGTL
jgi:hypothetical protein